MSDVFEVIDRWMKETSNSGSPYDDYYWDGELLTVFYEDQIERYTLEEIKKSVHNESS